MLETSKKTNLLEQKSYKYSLQDIKDPNLYRDIYSYDWNYFDDEKLGLFVKTVGGYKHILTGVTYNLANRKTGLQFVIKPDTLYEVCKYDRNLAKHIITKNNSYRVTLDQINYMEDRFNNDINENLEEDNLNR